MAERIGTSPVDSSQKIVSPKASIGALAVLGFAAGTKTYLLAEEVRAAQECAQRVEQVRAMLPTAEGASEKKQACVDELPQSQDSCVTVLTTVSCVREALEVCTNLRPDLAKKAAVRAGYPNGSFASVSGELKTDIDQLAADYSSCFPENPKSAAVFIGE